MATAKQIYNEIKGLNPDYSTVSSLGSFVSQSSQMACDSLYKEVIAYLPANSLAYTIMTSSQSYSEKQLWVISFELEKSEEYNVLVSSRIALREARVNAKVDVQKSKLSANKENSQSVLDLVKQNGYKLADYYEFVKRTKKYASEFYSKKFTMTSAQEFITK